MIQNRVAKVPFPPIRGGEPGNTWVENTAGNRPETPGKHRETHPLGKHLGNTSGNTCQSTIPLARKAESLAAFTKPLREPGIVVVAPLGQFGCAIAEDERTQVAAQDYESSVRRRFHREIKLSGAPIGGARWLQGAIMTNKNQGSRPPNRLERRFADGSTGAVVSSRTANDRAVYVYQRMGERNPSEIIGARLALWFLNESLGSVIDLRRHDIRPIANALLRLADAIEKQSALTPADASTGRVEAR